MRKILLVISLFFLTACNSVNSNIDSWMNDYLLGLSDEKFNLVSNHDKKYYNYYVPSNISNIESTSTHNIFKANNVDIIMNLNIADIISRKLYDKSVQNDKMYDDKYLIYTNNKHHFLDRSYTIDIYNLNDKYLINIFINDMMLSSYVSLNDLKDIIRDMLVIGASCDVYEDKVLSDFSFKDVIDYHKEQVDLFEMIIPKDGVLEELLNPNTKFDINDSQEDDSEKPEDTSKDNIDENVEGEAK